MCVRYVYVLLCFRVSNFVKSLSYTVTLYLKIHMYIHICMIACIFMHAYKAKAEDECLRKYFLCACVPGSLSILRYNCTYKCVCICLRMIYAYVFVFFFLCLCILEYVYAYVCAHVQIAAISVNYRALKAM